MDEIEFQTLFIKSLKEVFGSKIYILNTNMRHVIGVPDLLISLYGKFIAIELKVSGKNNPTIRNLFPIQRKQIITLYDIQCAGGLSLGVVLFKERKKIIIFSISPRLCLTSANNLKHINSKELNLNSNYKANPEFDIFSIYDIDEIKERMSRDLFKWILL